MTEILKLHAIQCVNCFAALLKLIPPLKILTIAHLSQPRHFHLLAIVLFYLCPHGDITPDNVPILLV